MEEDDGVRLPPCEDPFLAPGVRRGDGPEGGAGGGGGFARVFDGFRGSGFCVYGGGGADDDEVFDTEGRDVVGTDPDDLRPKTPGLPVSPKGVFATFPSRRDLISVSAR